MDADTRQEQDAGDWLIKHWVSVGDSLLAADRRTSRDESEDRARS